MRLLAATIALSALAAAVPQYPDTSYMFEGPCASFETTTCGPKDMVEDPNVKGNHMTCRYHQGEEQDDILCQVSVLSKGEQAKDEVSEICDALGGCTCAWWGFYKSGLGLDLRKRIAGAIIDFNCRPNPESKNTPAAREQYLKSIDEAVAEACSSENEKDVDEATCQTYKVGCIDTLSKDGYDDPITPDQVGWCVQNRVEKSKNRAPSAAR